jgi:hypothetical protein
MTYALAPSKSSFEHTAEMSTLGFSSRIPVATGVQAKGVLMADLSQVAQGPIPFEITDLERIPTKRYCDEELYKLECGRLWPHVWQMACRIEQVADVGDWIEYSNLGKSHPSQHRTIRTFPASR